MGSILKWLFFASLSVILMLQLRGLDSTLLSPDTPFGIVGYELAFTADRARAILDAWRSMDVLETVRVSLGLDVAFLLTYPWFFRVSCQLLRRQDGTRFDALGATLARWVLACTPLDLIENLVLWRMLETSVTPSAAALAGVAATIKFLLVLAAGLWCLVALSRRFTQGRPTPASR
jgi:hypothetical protein